MKQVIRIFVLAAFVFGALGFAAPAAMARTGSVRLELTSAGLVVGVSGGRGTLTFAGRNYPLRIGGVSLGATIGASRAELIGRAYNLRRASDIVGTYSAVSAGAAAAAGGEVIRLRNSRGVILELRGRQIGFKFSVDLSGMQISFR
jgi:hypothetical protein